MPEDPDMGYRHAARVIALYPFWKARKRIFISETEFCVADGYPKPVAGDGSIGSCRRAFRDFPLFRSMRRKDKLAPQHPTFHM
jgi:hypothetical protein